MINIETDRLTIRNFSPDDWRSLQELAIQYEESDVRYEDPWPASEEKIKGMIDYFVRGDSYLAVCLKETEQLIGLIAIEQRKDQERKVHNLGYMFHSDFYGRGYATEACRVAMEIVFKQWEAEGIQTGTHPDNLASTRLLSRLGLKEIRSGIYAISREEWLISAQASTQHAEQEHFYTNSFVNSNPFALYVRN